METTISRRNLGGAALLGLLMALAFLGSACGSAVSPSAAEAVALSGERFAEAEKVTITSEGIVTTGEVVQHTSGVSAFASNDLVYGELLFESEIEGEEFSYEMLITDDDLYTSIDGEWYVLSPWHQGTRPEELPDLGVNAVLADYARIADELEHVQAHSNETIDGVEYRRYTGRLDVDTFFGEESSEALDELGLDFSGRMDVELLVDDETDLPFKMESAGTIELGWLLSMETEISEQFDYESEIVPPEPPADAIPLRDLEFEDAPCTGAEFAGCLEAQEDLAPFASDSCEGKGRRICLIPLGSIDTDLVMGLLDYYRTEYGIEITLLTPLPVDEELFNQQRNQADSRRVLEDYLPLFWRDEFADPEAVMIALTPVDMYDPESHYRYLFGLKSSYSYPEAVVSMFRMTPEFYGEAPDDELTFERTKKLLNKYVGILYYGLQSSGDPESVMYNNILSAADLDRMNEEIPLDE